MLEYVLEVDVVVVVCKSDIARKELKVEMRGGYIVVV